MWGEGLLRIIFWAFSVFISILPIAYLDDRKLFEWLLDPKTMIEKNFADMLVVAIAFSGLAVVDVADTLRQSARRDFLFVFFAVLLLLVALCFFYAAASEFVIARTNLVTPPLSNPWIVMKALILAFCCKGLITAREIVPVAAVRHGVV